MGTCHRLIYDGTKLVVWLLHRCGLLILRSDRVSLVGWNCPDRKLDCYEVFLIFHNVELSKCLETLHLPVKIDSIFELESVSNLVWVLVGQDHTLHVFELCQEGRYGLTVFLD